MRIFSSGSQARSARADYTRGVWSFALLSVLSASLTLDEALAAADAAPELVSARAAALNRRQSASSLPSLTLNPIVQAVPMVRVTQGQPQLEGQLTVQQSVVLSDVAAARRDLASVDATQLWASATERAWVKHAAVARAWLDAWVAHESVQFSAKAQGRAHELVVRLEHALTTGGVTRAEVAAARAYDAEMKLQTLAWEGRRFEAAASLGALLGRDEVVYADEALPEVDEPTLGPRVSPTWDPHVRLLDAQLVVAGARAREAASSWGPVLHVSLTGGYEAPAQWLGGVGLGLTLPVFEKGQAELSAYRALTQKLEGERTEAERRASVEVQLMRHELEHTKEVFVLAHEQQMPAAREALELETTRFERGEVTLQELLLVQRQTLAAEVAERAAHADLLVARLKARQLVALMAGPERSPAK